MDTIDLTTHNETEAAVTSIARKDEALTVHDKAFAVPHILKSIIYFLGPEGIQQARKVCKHWKITCRDSKQVRVASVAHPVTTGVWANGPFVLGRYGCCKPHYGSGKLIQHPQMSERSSMASDPECRTFVIYRTFIKPNLRKRLEACCAEFVTSPPCSTVGITADLLTRGTFDRDMEHCPVYNPSGVKIDDVLRVMDIWLQQRPAFVRTEIKVQLLADCW